MSTEEVIPVSDEVTPENSAERMAWLRERGVQIELADSDPDKPKPSLIVPEGAGRSITIVKIPCNEKEDYEEVTMQLDDAWQHSDQLIELLASRFLTTTSFSLDDGKLKEGMKGLLASSPQTADLSVKKENIMDLLKGAGHAESFSLTKPSEANKLTSVSLYLDEAGQLKQLPRNARAVAIAKYCGFQGVSLVGDMYIARSRQNPKTGKLRAESFALKEIDSTSPWIKTAEHENYMRGVQEGRVAMSSGSEKKMASESDPSKAYSWEQTDDEVEVVFHLPDGTTGKEVKKSLDITISHDSLRVVRKGKGGEVLLDVSLLANVRPDESTWCVSKNDIEFTLEKVNEEEWKQLEE